jgi:hypothetical protein
MKERNMKIIEIDEQIAALKEQRDEIVKVERKAALAKVRELCDAFEFTTWDLRGALRMTAKDIEMEKLYQPIALEKKKKAEDRKKAKKEKKS